MIVFFVVFNETILLGFCLIFAAVLLVLELLVDVDSIILLFSLK